jgi:hypothetical protein
MDAKRNKRIITLHRAIEKSPILLSQFWKNYHLLRVTNNISHFDVSKNIFVDCILISSLFFRIECNN